MTVATIALTILTTEMVKDLKERKKTWESKYM